MTNCAEKERGLPTHACFRTLTFDGAIIHNPETIALDDLDGEDPHRGITWVIKPHCHVERWRAFSSGGR